MSAVLGAKESEEGHRVQLRGVADRLQAGGTHLSQDTPVPLGLAYCQSALLQDTLKSVNNNTKPEVSNRPPQSSLVWPQPRAP